MQRFCKRGHERVPGQQCKGCRRLRDNLKYETNLEFRETKKARRRAYKREFREKNGFWQTKLYT